MYAAEQYCHPFDYCGINAANRRSAMQYRNILIPNAKREK